MKRANKVSTTSKRISTLLGYRLREGGFILLSAISIFLFVALITHHHGDPGWSHTSSKNLIYNAAGKTGAWFSDIFLYLFGYIAYFFPLMIAYSGIRTFQNRFMKEEFHRLLWILRSIGFILTLISGCGLVSLHFNLWDKSSHFSAGGILGQALSKELLPALGYLGSTLLGISLFLAGVTLATGLSWFGLMDVLGKIFVLSLMQFQKKLQLFYAFYARDCWLNIKDKFRTLFNRNVVKTKTLQKNTAKRITPTVIDEKINLKLPAISYKNVTALNVNKVNKGTMAGVRHKDNGKLPSVILLEEPKPSDFVEGYSKSKLESMSREVEARLLEFDVPVTVVGVYPGPVITRFEMELAAGIKVSKITGLAKDLARALSVTRVRVVEVIPGKSVVGLEIPNQHRELVRLREIFESEPYLESNSPLSLALGKDIGGIPVVVDLAKMPHLLVAGTTGSGKSVGINVMLLSLLYKASPEDVRLILIDPKMLELSIYDGIPHLLTPVVTDMKDAANALRWCVAEMEHRYQLMAAVGVRNLLGYNRKILDAEHANQPILDPLWQPEMGGERPPLSRLPYIVVIIDEFADMMMVVGKKVEELIARIAQKARAAGIHLILATQRPSVDVITGLIKANVPTRVAFQVSSRIDSRTILDQQGAEQLLGHGDMLYLPPGTGIPVRIHGAFVSDDEVHAVVKALKLGGEPDYVDVLGGGSSNFSGLGSSFLEGGEDGEQDALYDEAVRIVVESRKASISHLQRRLKIGYNRAARLIETMEAAGVVSNMQSNGGREVLSPQLMDE